jgi:hypothetical protein
VVALTVAVWCFAGAPAGSPSTAPSAEVQALIAQLSDVDWRVREKAQARLVEFGEEARGPLEKLAAADDATPDARGSARRALKLLDEAGLTGQTRVTLHFKEAHPRDVIAALARQGRTELPIWPEGSWQEAGRKWPTLTIDIDRQPFWAAMRQVCEQAGLNVNTYGVADRLALTPHGGDGRWDGVAYLNGPFMFVARSASEGQSRTVGFGRDRARNASHSLSVAVTGFAEPKLRVLGRAWSPDVSEATDDTGRSLLGPKPNLRDGLDMNLHGNANVWDLTLTLQPAPGAKQLTRLKGSSKLLIQTKSETLELPDPLKARDLVKVVAGRRFHFKDMKRMGGGYSLNVTIHSPPGDGPEWQRRADPQNLRVFDAKGRPFSRSGYSGSGSRDRYDYEIRINPGGQRGEEPGEPAKLTWEVTTEAREIDAAFEFKDLPLP